MTMLWKSYKISENFKRSENSSITGMYRDLLYEAEHKVTKNYKINITTTITPTTESNSNKLDVKLVRERADWQKSIEKNK